MEDEEDDFYGGGDGGIKQEEQTATNAEQHEKDAMDVSEDEDDDSSDDVCHSVQYDCYPWLTSMIGRTIYLRTSRRRKSRTAVRRVAWLSDLPI